MRCEEQSPTNVLIVISSNAVSWAQVSEFFVPPRALHIRVMGLCGLNRLPVPTSVWRVIEDLTTWIALSNPIDFRGRSSEGPGYCACNSCRVAQNRSPLDF